MPTLFLTGATGALAQAIRDRFLADGWQVAGFARDADGFSHPSYRTYKTDATDETTVSNAFEAAAKEQGTPRALVATVGGIKPWRTVAETTIEDFRALFELNLTSFFLTAKHAMKLMSGEGSIISIGAEAALEPTAKRGGYAASKAGLIALSRVLAEEGKAVGITSNVIVPIVIDTVANREWGSADDIPKWTKPEDIAAMCLFLSGEAGKAVNGAVIRMPNRM
jgi:NAD(P)-dependent dehydrogenase (short-subunit alcohol dehydrogenase family)